MKLGTILINIVLTIVIAQNVDGKSPYLMNCGHHLECPEGYTCRVPGFGKASAKAQMKCYPSSNATTTAPESNATTTAPESNATTTAPESNVTTAAPVSHTSTARPVSSACVENNICGANNSSCGQFHVDCYIVEEEDILPNTWSVIYDHVETMVTSAGDCREICKNYAAIRCTGYVFNPMASQCFLYKKPMSELSSFNINDMTYYALRCASCPSH